LSDQTVVDTPTGPMVIDLESDQEITIGDWTGPAKNFRKAFIPQGEMTAMQERNKADTTAQLDAVKAQEAARYQQQLVAQQQRGQPVTPAQEDALEVLWQEADQTSHGYPSTAIMRKVTQMFRNEFAARDRVLHALGKKLDVWYGEHKTNTSRLDKVSGNTADKNWDDLMGEFATEFPDLPPGIINAIASGHEPSSPAVSPDSLRAELRQALTDHTEGLSTHRKAGRDADRQRQDDLVAVGMPGGPGAGVSPSLPEKIMRDADDITDAFFDAGSSPS
jgi:hypothetical protein